MPVILCNDFSVSQTAETVSLRAPLPRGTAARRADVVCSPKYLKISVPSSSWLLELFWSGRVRVEGGEGGGGGGRVTFARGEVFVELEKEAEEENGDGWGEEAYRKDLSSEEKSSLRAEARSWVEALESSLSSDRLRGRNEREREGTLKQLEAAEARREEGARRREEEKMRAMSEWAKRDSDEEEEETEAKKETSEVGPGDLDKLTRSDGKVSRIEEELGDPMPKLSRRRQRYSSSLAAKVARENERLRNLPPPRSETAVIEVVFSAARADKVGREEQKEKGDKTKKKGECSEKKEVEDADEHHEVEGQENEEETTIGHVGETEAEEEDVQDEDGKIDLERSERQEEENEEGEDYEEEEEEDGEEAVAQINSESQSDQSFLLRRGRELFQEGSVGAALETYSFGVKMHPKHVPFYNNRSACRLKVGDLHGCISDASAALDLLRGQAGGASGDAGAGADLLRQQRAKALSRRGAALAQLGLAREALGEFEAALEEQPDDEGLMKVRDSLVRKVEEEKETLFS